MDLLDGGSDLSDLSDAPPPTPGPVGTPTASPSRTMTDADPKRSSRRPSSRSTKPASVAQNLASEAEAELAAQTPSKSTSSKSASIKSAPSKAASSKATSNISSRSSRRGQSSSQIATEDLPASSSGPENDAAPKLKVKVRPRGNHARNSSNSRTSSPQTPSSDAKSSATFSKRTRKSDVRHSDRVKPKKESGEDVKEEPLEEAVNTAVKLETPALQPDGKPPRDATATSRRSVKRSRHARSNEQGTSRSGAVSQPTSDAPVGDDEEEEDKVKAPLRKRKKVMADDAFSSDEDSGDEEMQDLGTEEEEYYQSDADSGAPSRPAKGLKASRKKAGGPSKASTKLDAPFRASIGPAKDKPAPSKAISAEAKMRASIDAAKDKTLKSATGPASSKLNPSANSFRPGAKTPSTGASTPTSTAKPAGTASVGGKKGSQAAFGKSMSGWDQLFGSISGLSSSSTATPAKTAPGKPAPSQPSNIPTSATGIRPDPVLERATLAEIAQMRAQQTESYFNTDQCFDLLAHAEIMLAFEQDAIFKDRKTASLFRGSRFGAGNVPNTQT